MLRSRAFPLVVVLTVGLVAPATAQDANQVVGPFMNMVGTLIQQSIQQQEIERQRNSPDFRNLEIQPGGLTRAQVIIVQQRLTDLGYDVGGADGVIGPKTMAVVAQLQARAGTPVTGYPTEQLMDALLQQ